MIAKLRTHSIYLNFLITGISQIAFRTSTPQEEEVAVLGKHLPISFIELEFLF